jgi:hypothetical protein
LALFPAFWNWHWIICKSSTAMPVLADRFISSPAFSLLDIAQGTVSNLLDNLIGTDMLVSLGSDRKVLI